MLDEIKSDDRSDFIGGFPPHPHRGFETITYMRRGNFSHTDSMGHTGSITSGGAQWMTAGSGVIHSEMPAADADAIHGFQFWLNLPATEKMNPPDYRDIKSDEIISHQSAIGEVRIIAGEIEFESKVMAGPVTGKTTQPLIVDVSINPNQSVVLGVNRNLNLHFYVYQGKVDLGDQEISENNLAYLNSGDTLNLVSSAGAGLLLFGGLPLKEPVAHYGPFVMNTQAEIDLAIKAYQDGTLVQ